MPDIGGEDDDGSLSELNDGQAYLTDDNGSILTDESGRGIVVDVSSSHRSSSRASESTNFRQRVLKRLDDLEAAIQTYQNNLPPRNHNNPPELVDVDPLTPEELQLSAATVAELRAEAEKPEPDPTTLRTKAAALAGLASAIAAWIGRKIDRTVDRAIDWGTPLVLGSVGFAGWQAAAPETLGSSLFAAAEAVSAWANFLTTAF